MNSAFKKIEPNCHSEVNISKGTFLRPTPVYGHAQR